MIAVGAAGTLKLQVPNKQARSASLDTPYLLKVPSRTDFDELGERERRASGAQIDSARDNQDAGTGDPMATKSNRSRSVDISLPTRPGGSYVVVHGGAGMQSVSRAEGVADMSASEGARGSLGPERHRLALGEAARVAALLKAAANAGLGEK